MILIFCKIYFIILFIVKARVNYIHTLYRYIGKYSLLFVLLPGMFAAALPSEDYPLIRKSSKKRTRSPDRDDCSAAPIPIAVERIISAEDFLRWLNALLKYEACPDLRSLSRAECRRPECVITIHYHGGDGTLRSQEVYDPDHTFMNGEEFTPTDHNHISADGIRRGTRKVGFYPLDGERVLCLKENPEVPLLERAARLLYECLFGADKGGVPNSLTILVNGRVFTASNYVKGNSFDEIMRHTESDEKREGAPTDSPIYIDNLHKMKAFVILTGPEDGRPQNYIWQVVGSIDSCIVFRIFSIDNERILGNSAPHPSRIDAAVIVRGHSIMHCIPEVHPDYRNLIRILSVRTPRDIYRNWLDAVKIERLYHRRLVPYARTTGNTRLSLPITRERVRCVYASLISIYEGLREGRTLGEIFMQVNSPLAMVYRTVSADTPVTPPGIVLSNGFTPPQSYLKKIARRVRIIDAGRAGDSTPPSACCQLFGDYLLSQSQQELSTEVILTPASPHNRLRRLQSAEIIDSGGETDTEGRKRRRVNSGGKTPI